MKGKFRILGHVGLALFVACALMLAAVPAAKVEASSSVSAVWMELPAGAAAAYNYNKALTYTIHFTTGSAGALSRGVDTITVLFPDGIDTDMGPAGSVYAFNLGGAKGNSDYYSVDPDGSGTTYTPTTCTSNATVAGYRVKVTTPVDIPASTAAVLEITDGAVIKTPSHSTYPAVTVNTYKIKVATSQDTSFVPCSDDDEFSVGKGLAVAPDTVLTGDPGGADDNYPTSLVAGANAAYEFFFTPTTDVPADVTGTVTVQFPVGTYLPDRIEAGDVYIGDDYSTKTHDPHCSVVIVNTAARTVTATTQEPTDGDKAYIYFSTDCEILNPTTVGAKDIYMWTGKDGQKVKSDIAGADFTIVAGSATKLAFNNDALAGATYSDDATIVNAYTDALVIESQDVNGNLKDMTTEPTVKLSVTPTGAGAFYVAKGGAAWSASGEPLDGGTKNAFYRPTSAGTHTLKAEVASGPLTSAEWTVYVAPAVVLKDASGNTIGTYAPTATPATDDDDTYGGDWIQAAIDAAFPGDTVELGGTELAPAIYEVDADRVDLPWTGGGVGIYVNKQITLTSVTSALYTTLRNTENLEVAVYVTAVDGTATYPVIIDGLTFQRLRSGTNIRRAVLVDGTDYVTVRNCTFNYIMPEVDIDFGASAGPGAVVGYCIYNAESHISGVTYDITSATVSNNKFNNCSPFAPPSGETANILMFSRRTGGEELVGGVISGNELTDCGGRGICVKGNENESTGYLYVTASIKDNTITNPYTGIDLEGFTKDVVVTGNTITGAYRCGIEVSDYKWCDDTNGYWCHDGAVVKNNTVTGTAGSYAINVSSTDHAAYTVNTWTVTPTAPVVQYNDVSGSNGYAIRARAATAASTGQDCKYNYYGDASGPAYTALTGALVTTSNTAGTGDKITDRVTYYPWLYKSRALVVTDNAAYWAQRISLGVGWNTLSTPAKLITTANTIPELMPDYVTNMEYGYKWDPAEGGWVNIGTSSLAACSAYYIKMYFADTVLLQYAANETDTPTKWLDAGWNLIGLANFDSMLVNEAVASVLKDSAGLPGYSQVISPSMNTSSWSYSAAAASCTDSMLVGEGYWIYMQNDATLAGFTMLPLVPDLD